MPNQTTTSTPPTVRRLTATAIVTGLLGFLLFLSTPFLPVKQTEANFSWPQGGDLTSVSAPLTAFMPQDLDVRLPIAEARKLNPGETTVLSTVPEASKDATLRGMFVRSTPEGIDVVIRNVVPLTLSTAEIEALPEAAMLRITSNAGATTVSVIDGGGVGKGGADAAEPLRNAEGTPLVASVDDDIRPMVTGIYTEMRNTPQAEAEARAAGLQVDVTVDARFSSSPTWVKTLAMWLGLIMMVASLVALHRIDRLDGRGGMRPRGRMLPAGWWRPRPVDGVVGVVLLAWYIIGANTADDGYLLTMARASEMSGYISNYYRWFGVSESPFGSPFYDMLALMAKVSGASVWMRIPTLIAGVVTWIVLSREVLPRLGARIAARRVALWTMAAMFLAFWMTYNNGIRPEPIIAMFSLLAWVSFERAIATHRLLPAAIGIIFATLALSAGPTGLMAVSAMLVTLGPLVKILIRRLPTLGAPAGSSRGAIVRATLAMIAPFLAAGTAVLLAVFGDQTLQSVLEAVRVRGAVGPSVAWYEEYLRYTALLEQTVDGSFYRRYAIIMLLFSMGVVVASILRNGRVPDAAPGPSARLVLVILGTAFFMIFTPTKWTHHFGVYAGIGAALAALAAVAVSHVAVRSLRNRVLFIGVSLLLFAFTLAGPNGWWYVSSFGVPWWDKPIQLSGVLASSVMLFIALAVLALGAVLGFLTQIRTARAADVAGAAGAGAAGAGAGAGVGAGADEAATGAASARTTSTRMRLVGVSSAPLGVLTSLVVVMALASMAKGVVAQYPAYSVGKGNMLALAGNSCEMASAVDVETDTNESFLATADGSNFADSLTAGSGRDQAETGFSPNNIPAQIEPGSKGSKSGQQSQISINSGGDMGAGSDGAVTDAGTGAGSAAADAPAPSGAGSAGAAGAGSAGSGGAGSSGGASGTDGAGSAGSGGEDAADAEQGGTTSEESVQSVVGQHQAIAGAEDLGAISDSGTTGGVRPDAGINGSHAVLPYGIDPKRVPVVGSFRQGLQLPARTISAWYSLPERTADRPLIVISAAGEIFSVDSDGIDKYGQHLTVQFGTRSGDRFEVIGEYRPLDIGISPEWRNLRIPMSEVPAEATAIRIVAADTNLTPDQWLAFTPPRAPRMASLDEVIGHEDPGVIDWSAAFQFPCQRPYDHRNGVAELPTFRISPDHEARSIHTPVMDYKGGGSVGLMQNATQATELPAYLRDDWRTDWGVLDRLEPYAASDGTVPKPAELETREVTRSGLWSPGPMKYEQK